MYYIYLDHQSKEKHCVTVNNDRTDERPLSHASFYSVCDISCKPFKCVLSGPQGLSSGEINIFPLYRHFLASLLTKSFIMDVLYNAQLINKHQYFSLNLKIMCEIKDPHRPKPSSFCFLLKKKDPV